MSGVPFFSTMILAMFAFVGVVWLAFYIFEAIGLYTMSKRRGYQKAWLAFIPLVNSYVLGEIADNIGLCYGKKSYFRYLLLGSKLLSSAISIATLLLLLPAYFNMMGALIMFEDSYSVAPYLSDMVPLMAFSSFASLISLGYTVVSCISLYKIYQDYSAKSAVVFLVLSILFGIGIFFVFALRNKPSASLYWRSRYQSPASNPYQAPPTQPPAV